MSNLPSSSPNPCEHSREPSDLSFHFSNHSVVLWSTNCGSTSSVSLGPTNTNTSQFALGTESPRGVLSRFAVLALPRCAAAVRACYLLAN